MARQCWEEMIGRSRERKVGSEWEEEIRNFFEDRVGDLKTLERRREEGGLEMGKIMKRGEQRQKRWKRIRKSKFCSWSKEVK